MDCAPPSFGWCPNTGIPAAKRAEAMTSPLRARSFRPLKKKGILSAFTGSRMGWCVIRNSFICSILYACPAAGAPGAEAVRAAREKAM